MWELIFSSSAEEIPQTVEGAVAGYAGSSVPYLSHTDSQLRRSGPVTTSIAENPERSPHRTREAERRYYTASPSSLDGILRRA